MKNRDSKKALVLEGTNGIGSAICETLVDNGYEIIATTSEKSALNDASINLENVKFFEVDLANQESVDHFLLEIEGVRIDALINNASYFDFEKFEDFDFSIWDKSFFVNLRSPLYIIHNIKGQINDAGAIVNISTTDAFVGAFASSAWAASKSALLNLTKSLAINFGSRNIRSNAIAVGWIGNLADLGDNEIQRKSIEFTPLGRLGEPEEIAQIVLFLVSSQSSFVNASVVTADGGYSAVDVIGKWESESI